MNRHWTHRRVALALCALALLLSGDVDARDRLWLRVSAHCKTDDYKASSVTGIAAGIAATAIGSLVQALSDWIAADDIFVVSSSIAQQPLYVVKNDKRVFSPSCLLLNFGPKPVPDKPIKDLEATDEFKNSPVFMQLVFVPSDDDSALGLRVTRWKYDHLLDPTTAPFRKSERTVTVEVSFAAATGALFFTSAYAVTGTEAEIKNAMSDPSNPFGHTLAWYAMPSVVAPSPDTTSYGVVNIRASITELAEASAFAKAFSSGLSGQKTALEDLVRDKLNQALDPSAAAQATLTSLAAVQDAWTQYQAAHEKLTQDYADKAKYCASMQQATIDRAILSQRERFARTVFDTAHVSFTPLPPLSPPSCP
jgi:hypothetical protein